MRRCVSTEEAQNILWHCHNSPYEGHYSGERIIAKILQLDFCWLSLFKGSHEHNQNCNNCKRARGISKKNEMLLPSILEVQVFDCWGIDFVGPFPPSCTNNYILVAVDYISKWFKAIATPKVDRNTIVKFLKRNIFSHFRTPQVLINDGESHLCKSQLAKALKHYEVKHKVIFPYHPQTNGQ